jgi:hypothetical protein
LAAARPEGAGAFAAAGCLSVLGGLLAARRWSCVRWRRSGRRRG